MYIGIIYRYYIINEKGKEMSYIGQTCSEKQRRTDFLNLNSQYGGKRIDNARKKYGPLMFNYEIIETVRCETIEERSQRLNDLEMYYINLYNSYQKGYNNTIGGGGSNGYVHTEEYKQWQSKKSTELAKNPEYVKRISKGIKSFYESNPNARIDKSNEVRKRYENPQEREKISAAHKKSYADNPERVKKQAEKLSKTCSTLEGKKRMSETIKNAWKTETYRKKYSESKKALWATQEYRDKMKIAYKGMNGKRVQQSTLNNVHICEFESAAQAARQLGYSFGGICRVCRGERLHYKGYRWNYVEAYVLNERINQ